MQRAMISTSYRKPAVAAARFFSRLAAKFLPMRTEHPGGQDCTVTSGEGGSRGPPH